MALSANVDACIHPFNLVVGKGFIQRPRLPLRIDAHFNLLTVEVAVQAAQRNEHVLDQERLVANFFALLL